MTHQPPSHRPLPELVPTMSRLVERIAPRPVCGFTLVEMMVAVALASILILTAVACFRMVVKAVAQANQLSTENAMLRSGMLLALQDVDYWHSYADARQPWGKAWNRVRLAPDNPATAFTDESVNRREFAPVRFCPRTDTAERDPFPGTHFGNNVDYSLFNAANPTLPGWNNQWTGDYFNDPFNFSDMVPNPNAMLAHDSRSVARVPNRPLRVPEWEGWDWAQFLYQLGYPRIQVGDYTLVSASDSRDAPGAPNPRWPSGMNITIPLDYTPGQQPTIAYPTNGTINIPIDNGIAMYQSLLFTDMFQRLSYLGMYEYMTPGTPIFMHDSTGRTIDYMTRPLAPYCKYRMAGGNYTYVWDRDFQINDRMSGGNVDVSVRLGDTYSPTGGVWNTARITAGLPFLPCWPSTVFNNQDADSASFNSPFSIFMGSGGYWGGTEGLDQVTNWGGTAIERGDMSRNDINSLSTTVWLPYNLTDYERSDPNSGTALAPGSDTRTTFRSLDYINKPANAPVMSTSILRYGRVAGSMDLTVCRVSIDTPDGHRVELPLMPFGTTYRGARQYWRLYSKGIGFQTPGPMPSSRFGLADIRCIGDFYDEGDGPYYVASSAN